MWPPFPHFSSPIQFAFSLPDPVALPILGLNLIMHPLLPHEHPLYMSNLSSRYIHHSVLFFFSVDIWLREKRERLTLLFSKKRVCTIYTLPSQAGNLLLPLLGKKLLPTFILSPFFNVLLTVLPYNFVPLQFNECSMRYRLDAFCEILIAVF